MLCHTLISPYDIRELCSIYNFHARHSWSFRNKDYSSTDLTVFTEAREEQRHRCMKGNIKTGGKWLNADVLMSKGPGGINTILLSCLWY